MTALLDAARAFARDPGDPTQVQKRLHAAGLSHWWIPGRHGGPGVSFRDGVDVVAELAYGDAGIAFSSVVSVIGALLSDLYGRPAWAGPLLGSMARGGALFSVLGTEHEAGSEMGRMTTTATPHGDEIVLDGDKAYSTNADEAGHLLVVARTADGHDDLHSHVAVVLDRDAPGVHVGKRWATHGLASSPVYEVSLRGARTGLDRVLDGHGLRMLEVGLNPSRILIAATAVGMARRVRDLAVDFGKGRSFRGGRLSGHATFAGRVGQMEIDIEVMATQCRAAAAELDALLARPDAAGVLAARGALRSALAAKVHCGRAGWEVASSGSEMFGGLGYTDDSPIGAILRDMRYVALVEGGVDMLREQVFRRFALPPGRRA